MNNSTHSLKVKVPSAIGLLLITLLIVGVIVLGQTKKDMATSKSASMSTSGNSNTAPSSQTYKDGTYSAKGSYTSPAGAESVTVSLTIASNTVASSTVVSGANDPTATSYQSIFISGYKGYVDGKKVNEINLTNVSGSSLTPQGFMNALKEIENNAKA